MSVRVHVRHFLTAEGLAAFPRLFEEHRRQVAAFRGFVSLLCGVPFQEPSPGSRRRQEADFARSNSSHRRRRFMGHEQLDFFLEQGTSQEAARFELEVTLEFENGPDLSLWRSSPQHAQIADGYRRFWTREPVVTVDGTD